MFKNPAANLIGRAILVSSILLLILLAWIVLWVSDNSALHLLHIHDLCGGQAASGTFMVIFIAGWTVMTVAMMLPTVFPLIIVFHKMISSRVDRYFLILLMMAGYLFIWVLFGFIVYWGFLGLNSLVSSSGLVPERVWGPLLLVLAGAFQLTNLKYRCLEKCRSPVSFVIEHWQGRRDMLNAFRLGFDNGIYCIGCCWALMLLMFIVGTGSLVWMLVLAVFMAVEKNVAWGRKLSTPIGIILIGWGVILIVIH